MKTHEVGGRPLESFGACPKLYNDFQYRRVTMA